MSSRWWVDQKTYLANVAARILLSKPANPFQRALQRAVAAVVPDVQKTYMQDDLVDEDIEFDAEALRRYRDSK